MKFCDTILGRRKITSAGVQVPIMHGELFDLHLSQTGAEKLNIDQTTFCDEIDR